MQRTSVLLLVTFAIVQWAGIAVKCEVRMAEGEYKGVVVALDSDIPSESRLPIVNALQSLFTEASNILNKAIRLHFGEVVVLFPLSWSLSSFPGLKVGTAKTSEQHEGGAISISAESEKTVFGEMTYTVQHGGCGVPGLRINIPYKYLLSEDVNTGKAKLLAKEWIKYRYGVFDEGGFIDDVRYPEYYRIPGTDEVTRITDCSNIPILYKFQDKDGNNCSLDAPEVTDNVCTAKPDSERNDRVTSSLMSLQLALPNVNFLCGDETHPHDKRSPNKHNTQCNSRSVWDVLKYHNDFKGEQNRQEQPIAPPEFLFVQETPARVVLAVDFSSRLTPLKALVKNTVGNLVYSLPGGSEFGFVNFNESATSSSWNELQVIPAEEKERNNIILEVKVIKFSSSSVSCSVCGIERAMQLLSPNRESSSGIIIVMTANNPGNLDAQFLKRLTSSELCLHVITFPGATSEGFYELMRNVHCGDIYDVPADVSIGTLKKLFEIVDSIISKGHSQRDSITLKTLELAGSFPMEFAVDQSLSSFTLWLSDVKAELEVTNEDLEVVPEEDVEFQRVPLTLVNFVGVRFHMTKAMKWTCTLKLPVGQSVLLIVRARPKEQSAMLEADAWAEDNKEMGQRDYTTTDQAPVTLYAKVSHGADPVINSRVTAEISRPGRDDKINFPLLDNGLGDPDITGNDGIYSRYFIQFTTAGQYEVTVRVDDNDGRAKIAKARKEGEYSCCGSVIRQADERSTSRFQREIKFSFHSAGRPPENGYKPSRIRDLRVLGMDRPTHFTLQWTAPGAEKDHGKALAYNLKLFGTREEALNAISLAAKSIQGVGVEDVKPEPYGTLQKVAADVGKAEVELNRDYYFVLLTTNERGKNESSNVVEIFVAPEEETTTPVDLSSSTPSATGANKSMDKAMIGITVGVVILAVILVILAYVTFYFCYAKKRNVPKEEEQDNNKSTEDNKRTKKRDQKTINDGSVTATEWRLDDDPISPVNFMPASVILNHHQQVEEAKRNHRQPPLFKLENLRDSSRSSSSASNGRKPSDGEQLGDIRAKNSPEISVRVTNDTQHPKPLRRVTKV